MKAAVLTGTGKIEIADVPRPRITGEGDVLLRVDVVGVCGSDVHYYETGRIGSQVVEYPFIVGHECAGVVVETGKAVSRVKPHDRVFIEPAVTCGECDQCRAGRANTCRNLKFLGCPQQVGGCLCEYIVMPEHCCFGIGPDLSLETAVLCEPLAIGLYAVRGAAPSPRDSAAILGAGPIGLSCLLALQHAGVEKCFMTEKIPERIGIASAAGAAWVGNAGTEDVVAGILERSGGGVKAVFECAGQQETVDQAVELLEPGGKLMMIGIPRTERISVVIDKARRKEITVVNVRRQNNCTGDCLGLIASGKIRADFMITHRFAFERAKEAFDTVAGYRDGVLKAMIEVRQT
jgi:L-iditol 2-dehydrogenase